MVSNPDMSDVVCVCPSSETWEPPTVRDVTERVVASSMASDTNNVPNVPMEAVTSPNVAESLAMVDDVIPSNSSWTCPTDAKPERVASSPLMSATECPCPSNDTLLPLTVMVFAEMAVTDMLAVDTVKLSNVPALAFTRLNVAVSFCMDDAVIPLNSGWTCPTDAYSEWVCPSNETLLPFTVTELAEMLVTDMFACETTRLVKVPVSAVTVLAVNPPSTWMPDANTDVATNEAFCVTFRFSKVPVFAVTEENEASVLDIEVEVIPSNSGWVWSDEALPINALSSPVTSVIE